MTSGPCPPAAAEEALGSGLGKALLRRFDDSSEVCRDYAASIFLHLLQQGEATTLQMLPYAMPVLEERLQIIKVSQRSVHAPQGCVMPLCEFSFILRGLLQQYEASDSAIAALCHARCGGAPADCRGRARIQSMHHAMASSEGCYWYPGQKACALKQSGMVLHCCCATV